MRRRNLIAGLVITTVTWPLAAHAQQPAIPVIGFLSSASPQPFENYVAGFRAGLKETGYVDGQNVTIEFRWAEGHYDRLPVLAAELVQRNVAVIFASGGPPSALAAKAASVTTPIVFILASDPIKLGFVASLSHPGGTATGVGLFNVTVEPKKLEILHQLVPKAMKIGVLVNPRNPNAQTIATELQTAAGALGLQIHIVNAATDGEFGTAFTTLVQQQAGALVVAADPFFTDRREALVALAAQHALPAIYEWREFAAAGGLVSYGTIISDAYRQAGVYTGRILKGEKAADLPVQQPTKFELVINIKTAKTLGITVPQTLAVAADEVIE
jgi:putative tryptophan/tyrosine transport system substrate-binding protein